MRDMREATRTTAQMTNICRAVWCWKLVQYSCVGRDLLRSYGVPQICYIFGTMYTHTAQHQNGKSGNVQEGRCGHVARVERGARSPCGCACEASPTT